MWAVILILGAVVFFVERWSIRSALTGVEYDMRLSRRLAEPGEDFDMVTTLRMTRRRIAPFLRVQEDAPPEFEVPGAEAYGSLRERRRRIVFSTYLLPRQQVTRRVTGRIQRRGRYRFNGAYLYGGDFLGLTERMRFVDGMREIVVAPQPLSAPDAVKALGGYLGDISVTRFMLEDPVLTLGFRDYTGREPMKDISWPVSLRSGRLMVKQFDHTLEVTLSVVLNIDTAEDGDRADGLRETCFRLTRDVCQTLEDRRIPYAFYTNSVAAGHMESWSYISEGLGERHFQSILEGLGRATHTCYCRSGWLLDGVWRRAEAGRAHVIVTPKRADIEAQDLERLRARTGAQALILSAEEVAGL